MTTNELLEIIRKTGGNTPMTITFKKRTTGEMRVMICKLGVQKDNDRANNLLRVIDVQKDGMRAIPIDGITKATIKGNTYHVEEELPKIAGKTIIVKSAEETLKNPDKEMLKTLREAYDGNKRKNREKQQ